MKSDKIYACLVYWHTPATLASQESEAKGHEFKACLSYSYYTCHCPFSPLSFTCSSITAFHLL